MKYEKEPGMDPASKGINRRQFLGYGGAALAGAAAPAMLGASVKQKESTKAGNGKSLSNFRNGGYKEMIRDAFQYRKIDVHNHTGNLKDMIESMDRMGIQ